MNDHSVYIFSIYKIKRKIIEKKLHYEAVKGYFRYKVSKKFQFRFLQLKFMQLFDKKMILGSSIKNLGKKDRKKLCVDKSKNK